MVDFIKVRGARTHNLKNINVDIPRNKLVVITGLSGSGKSSLAFDTLYAEGQRRYVESLSSYARQFLNLMPKPDVDSIEGLSPAIAIEQKNSHNNPRSTVATVTEIYDYLRLLFARVGVPYSPVTGLPIIVFSNAQIIEKIIEFPINTKFLILSKFKPENFEGIKKQGFSRFKIDGDIYEADDMPDIKKAKECYIVVDRLIRPNDEQVNSWKERVVESIDTGFSAGNTFIVIEECGSGKQAIFSRKYECPISGFSISEMEPSLFSFNSYQGACKTCKGIGNLEEFDPDLLVADQRLSLVDAVLPPWKDDVAKDRDGFLKNLYQDIIASLAQHYKVDVSKPFYQLPDSFKQIILYGSGKNKIPFGTGVKSTFAGAIPLLMAKYKKASHYEIANLNQYRSQKICHECNGFRLNSQALCVRINNKHIGEICNLSIKSAHEFFSNLEFSRQQHVISERILKEIKDRCYFLNSLGLGYITLNRVSGTLSGGEMQRIRLASQIGSQLSGVLYVLDEPSIGLHQRDNDRLIKALQKIRDLGNSVIVVEHDEDTMLASDHIIDIGPLSGEHGGEIISEGTPQHIIKDPLSLTGQYLNKTKCIPLPKQRRSGLIGKSLILEGVDYNNLKNVNVEFPLGKFICVTGISGSGKSSLIMESLRSCFSSRKPKNIKKISGLEYIDQAISITQDPIGRTPRSNPATYVGFYTSIREWYAALPLARSRGYSVGRFSFNVKGGRCEACQGEGEVRVSMLFLPDVFAPCDQCQGKRFNAETLEIKYKDASIADVLDMTVDETVSFFKEHPALQRKLEKLQEVGLGYIKIGQAATTLSGGEAQRIKLAKELSKRSTGKSLYILDEPTTGLHFEDIRKLQSILHSIVDLHNTVVVIEHNLDIIKTADWIIDLGPEGGEEGGEIIAVGPPEEIVKNEKSITGYYLQKYLLE